MILARNRIEDIYEVINDKKTYSILDSIKNGEKETLEILKDAELTFKPFRYLSSRMYDAGLILERETIKTRFFAINKDGVRKFIEYLQTIPDTTDAVAKLSKYC